MEKNQCSFKQLPFSNLFSTYIHDYSKLKDFFSANPFDDSEVLKRIERIPDYPNRNSVVEALSEYHSELGITDSQKDQLAKFSNQETLVVVTGQQLGMYGGPLFTVYKTVTTILLAEEWERKLNRPVVPVFWLADEDHDFAEIAAIGFPSNEGKQSVTLNEVGNGIPVSEEILNSSLDSFNQELNDILHETDFTEELWHQLENCYKVGENHASAFAKLMCTWFAKYGLLVVGSNHKSVKKLLAKTFFQSVDQAENIHQALENQSSELEKTFHRQVVVGDSNLFLLGDNGRSKFQREGENWKVDDSTFTKDEIIALIEKSPQDFSPNVFLRPIIQDVLLPTVGYVAGPGELAYYAQMKTYYRQFDMEMPVIFPRISATLLESGIDRIMEKLPFEMCSYNQRIEDLESRFIELNSSTDIDELFSTWISELKTISKSPIEQIQNIDPTLKGASGKLISGVENDLNKLKGRVIRAIKQQEETQLKRIARIKSQLFPDGLQERSVNPTYFMNKYGLDVWDKLLEDFRQEPLDLQNHHIIKL